MKRLLIVFSVVISSFFLFKEDVKADITVTSSNIETYITEDFLYKRDIVVNFANENNYDYFIVFKSPTIYYLLIKVNWASPLSASSINLGNAYSYKFDDDLNFVYSSQYSMGFNITFSNFLVLDSSRILYSTNAFNIICDDTTYVVNDINPFMTYYDLYLLDNPVVQDNIHQEEIYKIGSFYSICIEKIEYLVNEVVNNYIYLSMISIFILIFVIQLTRRYLL